MNRAFVSLFAFFLMCGAWACNCFVMYILPLSWQLWSVLQRPGTVRFRFCVLIIFVAHFCAFSCDLWFLLWMFKKETRAFRISAMSWSSGTWFWRLNSGRMYSRTSASIKFWVKEMLAPPTLSLLFLKSEPVVSTVFESCLSGSKMNRWTLYPKSSSLTIADFCLWHISNSFYITSFLALAFSTLVLFNSCICYYLWFLIFCVDCYFICWWFSVVVLCYWYLGFPGTSSDWSRSPMSFVARRFWRELNSGDLLRSMPSVKSWISLYIDSYYSTMLLFTPLGLYFDEFLAGVPPVHFVLFFDLLLEGD